MLRLTLLRKELGGDKPHILECKNTLWSKQNRLLKTGSPDSQTDQCSELRVSSPVGMFLLDGRGEVRRCKRGVVSGHDQRVAVVIFNRVCVCTCMCVSHWPPLSRWLNHDGSDLRSLPLPPTHPTSFLPFSLNTPPSNSFLHSFPLSLSLSLCVCRQGALSHVRTVARERRN